MDRPSVTQYDFEIVESREAAQGVWQLLIRSDVARAIQPGQFMNLRVPGDGSHILRIPLSFAQADRDRGLVDLAFAVVGEGTERLSRMRVHDRSTLVGPCGNGWHLPDTAGRALLVAGGVGLPPIVAAAQMLSKAGIGFDVVVGARTGAAHVERLLELLRRLPVEGSCDCPRRVLVTTDDGTLGIAGFTTEAIPSLLSERAYAQAYACGPQPMMAGVARLAAGHGIACQVSMERMMGCGFGACSCCNVPLVSGGYALCCQDGPVFDAGEVAW